MHSRLQSFAHAFRASRKWAQPDQPGQRPRIARFICQSCRHNFSPVSALHKLTQASRRTITTAQKNIQGKQYAEQLIIYQSSSNLTAFVGVWKALALFQFGVCTVWVAPTLYFNDNQPDKSVRIFQSVGVTLLATFSSLILSFLTSPYVTSIKLWPVPPHARRSLRTLRAFAAKLPPTTRLTFQTLRTFPMPKHTDVYASELRSLPPRKFRFANLELPKTDAWRASQRGKSFLRRAWEFVEERRFKFYVRESPAYTVVTGVPGVWESVERGIRERTEREGREGEEGKGGVERRGRGGVEGLKKKKEEVVMVKKAAMPVVKRQTARRA